MRPPFRVLLERLEHEGVRHAVLRDTPTLAGRDLDLLVDEGQAHALLACCEALGFQLLRDDWLNPGKVVLAKWQPSHTWLLDVHFRMIARGLEFMDASLVLERRVRARDHFTLSAEDHLLALLLHNVIGKRQLQPKHVPLLADALRAPMDHTYLEAHAATFGLAGLVERVRGSFAELASDRRKVGQLADECTASILRRQPRQRLVRARLAWRRTFGFIRGRRRGLLIAFLGPDGTGKSTAIEATRTLLEDAGIPSHLVYLGPWGQTRLPLMSIVRSLGLVPRLGPPQGALISPSGLVRFLARRRNDLAAACYFTALSIELWYRYLRLVAPAIRTGRVVLADRYVYDIEAAFKTQPVRAYARLRRLVARCYPTPDVGIVLLAAPEVISARKPQISQESLPEILEAYARLARRRDFVVVDAGDRLGATMQAFSDRCLPDILDRVSAPPTSFRRA